MTERDGFAHDPIHQNSDEKWYFYDETWSNELGPYDTKEQAEEKLEDYCRWLNGEIQ